MPAHDPSPNVLIVLIIGYYAAITESLTRSSFISLNFYILAKLAHATVGQGFVFAFMVYVLAWIKSLGQQYFAFSLLAILSEFQSVTSSS